VPKTTKTNRRKRRSSAEMAAASKGSDAAAAPSRASKGPRTRTAKALIPKEELAQEIATIIRYHHLTQTEAARVVGDAPSQISLLMSGKIGGFSTERLLRMLLRLGRDIDLVFRPAANPRAAKFRISHKSELGAPPA